ncbi:MAG: lysylphosphatidylglycerol synthase domain-containing protein [Bacteroidota bacterium]|nr:lysylphosphatidylglycerol synthase domain-containing protein [Bacteroidota bacterium]
MNKSNLRFDLFDRYKSYKHLGQFFLALISIFYFLSHYENRLFSAPLFKIEKMKEWISNPWIFLVIFLFFLGILVESIRWRALVRSLEQVTTVRAIAAILMGAFYGSFMPNRVGEFGGRLLVLQSKNQAKSIPINMLGGTMKFFVNILFGLLGLIIVFLYHRHFYSHTEKSLSIVLMIVIFVWLTYRYLTHSKLWDKRLSQFSYLSEISRKTIAFVFLLSIVRYLIFTSQFLFLLNIFHLPQAFEHWYLVFVFYLFQTVNPVMSIFDLGLRGLIAESVFGPFHQNFEPILQSITFLWILNVICPAIFGAVIALIRPIFKKSLQ